MFQGWDTGSSPRLRGTGAALVPFGEEVRFIPAPAGNRPSTSPGGSTHSVHPRACGEQSLSPWRGVTVAGSSPRLRGTGRWYCWR